MCLKITLLQGFCYASLLHVCNQVFFLLTLKDNDGFYSYFRWSWFFYSSGFAAVIATSYLDFQYLLVLKAVFDMISLLTFLFAIYHLFHVQIPNRWVKWTVFTALWVAIATYLRLDILYHENTQKTGSSESGLLVHLNGIFNYFHPGIKKRSLAGLR